MDMYPRLEARVSALERRQFNTETRIEEFARDTTMAIKQLSDDMSASFKQLTEYPATTEEKNEERFSKIEGRLDRIEADITSMKADVINVKTTLGFHTELFAQILTRLPNL